MVRLLQCATALSEEMLFLSSGDGCVVSGVVASERRSASGSRSFDLVPRTCARFMRRGCGLKKNVERHEIETVLL